LGTSATASATTSSDTSSATSGPEAANSDHHMIRQLLAAITAYASQSDSSTAASTNGSISA